MAKCPSCSKFCGLEMGDVEVNSVDVLTISDKCAASEMDELC